MSGTSSVGPQRVIFSPELAEQMAGGPRHAAMKNVADNRDLQAFQRFLVAEDRVRIEQRLRWMLVQSISGIDNGHVDMLRHHMRRARVRMANDDDIGADSANRISGIEQRFPFLNTRTHRLNEHGMRAQRLGCDFKGTPSTGRRLVKQK